MHNGILDPLPHNGRNFIAIFHANDGESQFSSPPSRATISRHYLLSIVRWQQNFQILSLGAQRRAKKGYCCSAAIFVANFKFFIVDSVVVWPFL